MGLLDISSVFNDQDSPENLKKKLIIHKKMISELEQKLVDKEIEAGSHSVVWNGLSVGTNSLILLLINARSFRGCIA